MKHMVDANEIPFKKIDRSEKHPGVGKIPDKLTKAEEIEYKFLGRDPNAGPWIFMVRFPAGHHIDRHSHLSDRTEYLLEGEIYFDGKVFGSGSLNYVTAKTEYEYDIVKDSTILLVFNGPPGLMM